MLYSIGNSQPGVGEMVFVEGGTIAMGSKDEYPFDETPEHNISIDNYYICKYEITIENYSIFCNSVGKPVPAGKPNFPATNISWEETLMYSNWLSQVNGYEKCYEIKRTNNDEFSVTLNSEADGYRLPTEAEWEYAARGGMKSRFYTYSGSNEAYEVAWYLQSGHRLHEVGKKKPNELGIYDMSGNCLEWCWDFYDENYYKKKVIDNPLGAEIGTEHVARSGNYNGTGNTIKITTRFHYKPDYKDKTLGIRLVRSR